jgi:competence protein ComEA
MKKTICSTLLFAVMTACCLNLATVSGTYAAETRKEVEQRLELNNVTAKDLAATGVVSLELANKIVELREQLGSFQTYGDLEELKIPKEQFEKLQQTTTIQGIASDCTC